MSDKERITRPPVDRVRPIRTWDGIWRRSQASAEGAPSEGTAPRVEDVVARSVELGYRVVDDYIKRGQQAAQRIRDGAYGAGDVAQDIQGVAGQLVRSASDLVGAWVEFAALAGAGTASATGATAQNETHAATDAGAPPSGIAHPTAGTRPTTSTENGDGAQAGERLRVRLSVIATGAVEASLDLRPIPADHHVVVYRVRMDADPTVHIDDVRVDRASDGTAVIRVIVPATQVAGRYSGVVVDDDTNVPVGEISLVVSRAD